MSGKRSKEIRRVAREISAKSIVKRKLSRWQCLCNWVHGRKETGKLTPTESRRIYQRVKGIVNQMGAAQLSE